MILSATSLLTIPNLIYATIFFILYLSLLSTYRIFFHPLSKYPGPLSYKLSGWPLLWQAYTGDRHIHHLNDHAKFGPIVRISPNTLSFNTASALHSIYSPRSANVQKGEWYKTFNVAAGNYSTLTETDREEHAVKKRWLGPVFTSESIKANESKVRSVIERFCDTLASDAQEGWGKKWNASEMTTYLGFDVMGEVVFGTGFRSVQEEENRPLADAVLPASRLLYWISYLPAAVLVRPFLRTKLFQFLGGKSVADNNHLIDYAASQVQLRQAEEKKVLSERTDLLSRFVGVEDKKTGRQPPFAYLVTESLDLLIAGSDPFSGMLAGAIFYLVHNSEALEKATQEVRKAFTSLEEIVNGPILNECVYLYAVIEETLRRASPVPSHLPRLVLPGGLVVDGEHVPEGTVVGVSMYTLHHNPDYFPDPFEFSPERWIESKDNSADDIARSRRAYFPFQTGSRMCSGRALAYMQFKLTLAHILWRFDIRESPDERGRGGGMEGLGFGRERVNEFQLWDALGFGRDGPMIQVKVAS